MRRFWLELNPFTGVNKIFGLFIPGGKIPEMFWGDGSAYTVEDLTLAEMTTAALDILKKILMVSF